MTVSAFQAELGDSDHADLTCLPLLGLLAIEMGLCETMVFQAVTTISQGIMTGQEAREDLSKMVM